MSFYSFYLILIAAFLRTFLFILFTFCWRNVHEKKDECCWRLFPSFGLIFNSGIFFYFMNWKCGKPKVVNIRKKNKNIKRRSMKFLDNNLHLKFHLLVASFYIILFLPFSILKKEGWHDSCFSFLFSFLFLIVWSLKRKERNETTICPWV